MVLLNNNKHALPLSPSVGKVAVVGPLADDALDQLGPDVPIGYSTTPADLAAGGADKIVTVRQGIENVVGSRQRRLRGRLHRVYRHRPLQRDDRVRRGGSGGECVGRDRRRGR